MRTYHHTELSHNTAAILLGFFMQTAAVAYIVIIDYLVITPAQASYTHFDVLITELPAVLLFLFGLYLQRWYQPVHDVPDNIYTTKEAPVQYLYSDTAKECGGETYNPIAEENHHA